MDLDLGTRSGLPLLVTAVKWRFPDFLHCERRKSGICRITAVPYSGNLSLCNTPSTLSGGKPPNGFFFLSLTSELGHGSGLWSTQ